MKARRPQWTEREIRLLWVLADAGMTRRQAAERARIPLTQVHHAARQYGVPFKPGQRRPARYSPSVIVWDREQQVWR